MRGDAGDHFMFFDASRELPGVRDLTEVERAAYLDSDCSVSGLFVDSESKEINGCEHVSGPLRRVLRQLSLFGGVEDG